MSVKLNHSVEPIPARRKKSPGVWLPDRSKLSFCTCVPLRYAMTKVARTVVVQ